MLMWTSSDRTKKNTIDRSEGILSPSHRGHIISLSQREFFHLSQRYSSHLYLSVLPPKKLTYGNAVHCVNAVDYIYLFTFDFDMKLIHTQIKII